VGRYISLPLLLVAVVIQSTIVPEIRVGNGGPDLILMMTLSWAMLAGLEEGIVWALVGGILQDLSIGIPTGTTALALVIVVFLSDLVIGQIGRNNLIFPPLVIGIGTVVYHFLLAVLLSIIGRPVSIPYMLTYITLPTLAFHVVMILPIFRIMGWIFQASRPKRVTL
jgi:rod shape-determining protein MreD